MILNICEDPKILEITNILNIFIMIIRIVVPLILIFSLIIKFAGAITKSDEDGLKKILKIMPKNLIVAAVIFLIPTIVRIVVKITTNDTSYENCLKIVSTKEINTMYENKIENLIKYAEESEDINSYNNAYNYLKNIKNEDKRKEYNERLATLKEKIDKNNQVITGNNIYGNVNYNNFKWTYYKSDEGPLTKYSENFGSYAVWGPENVNDLNGVSLPLIIWLHGSGEVSKNHVGEQGFLNSGLLKVMSNWNTYGLKPVPAIIVAPQSYGWWGGYKRNHNTINGLVEYTADHYKIDRSKIVLMGHSMGGNGTIEIAWEMKNLNLYAAVTMSTQVTSYKVSEGGQEFYSKLKMKGYGEFANHQKFYDWIGQSQNYTYYKGEQHGKVPERAMTEDLNNDGVSDLVYWLFGNLGTSNSENSSNNEEGVGTTEGIKRTQGNCNRNGKYQWCSPNRGKFGSFPYYDSEPNSTSNRSSVEMDPKWAKENFVSINKACSNGWVLDFVVNVKGKETWEKVLDKLCQITTTGIDGYKYNPNEIKLSGRTPVVRFVSNTKTISNHSYGTAIDINPSVEYTVNGKKYIPYNRDINEYKKFVNALGSEMNKTNINYILWKKILEPLGFNWGGNWGNNYDGMHFELKQ